MAEQPPKRPGLMWYVVALIALLLAVLAVMFFGYDNSALTKRQDGVTAGDVRR
jgi:hypothetical protein